MEGRGGIDADGGVRLLGPVEIRARAAALGLTPTKKLGQNFVHDPNTVRRIVEAARLGACEHVLEIGPGLGSLTLGLLEAADRVSAVEIDPRLAEALRLTVADRAPAQSGRLSVTTKDALMLAPSDVDRPTALVANLPYNVSVPVLLHALETFPTIRRVLVMVQAEVADRLAARPGSKTYGVPSAKLAFFGDARRAGAVGPSVFWPAPRVSSGLVRVDIRGTYGRELSSVVFPLIDAAFGQRRKTLRAALSGYFGSGAAAEEALLAAEISPSARGESLGIADFVRLATRGAASTAAGAAARQAR